MKAQNHRLPQASPRGLSGSAIDRSRPIRFTLNGRVFHGFAGDTVLSALLASGVDTLGTLDGHPMGLRAAAAPSIAAARVPGSALPMERTFAQDEAEYVTWGNKPLPGMFSRLFHAGRSLGLNLTRDGSALDQPWRSQAGIVSQASDLLVIGGGVAGMSAALAGARTGLTVTLVEASLRLGGSSGLFGTQDGESTPEDHVAQLTAEIAASDAITILTATEVFALTQGLARAHRVQTEDSEARAEVVDLPARQIVIATGSLERLPLFAGNRLPGVCGALEAYELASRFGIWPGASWLLATASNPAYRLPILMHETRIKLDRILEGRDHANSRFIEFCKAYGIRQFPGTLPHSATPSRRGEIEVHPSHGEPVTVDRLIVCGGWQPDLTLWHMAGGLSRWSRERQRLEPTGSFPSIALAGSAAGFLTRRGCQASGIDAVERLLGRNGSGVDDPVIDAVHETPDGWIVSPETDPRGTPGYLDSNRTLLRRPAPVNPGWAARIFERGPTRPQILSQNPQPVNIGSICAGVVLGLIPEEAAGIAAQERVALVPLAGEEPSPSGTSTSVVNPVPAYLQGRFGPDERMVAITHESGRTLGPGCLIFAGEDDLDPLHAVGVILRTIQGETAALVSAHTPARVIVRDSGQNVPAETVPLSPKS
ncbi:sarcosine oxidase subunit alpha [Devosia crocina]|uniref:Sarcosine oxidase subunit alpha n=1 Tax=Devosia crocina TaxID=429728 RepID=A0A1I7NMC0_9HYPH|nr:FAD-dependent oxidoreductase [Devosia crocina]SFV35823.1 sarcosine oxidase subunit alpha [Devosia crocina]